MQVSWKDLHFKYFFPLTFLHPEEHAPAMVRFEVRSLQRLISVPSSSQVPAQQLIILLQHIATATGLLQKKISHALNIDSVDLMCIDYKGVWAEWVMEMSAFSQHCFWRDDIEGLALPWAAKQPQHQKIAEAWRADQELGCQRWRLLTNICFQCFPSLFLHMSL